MLTRNLNVRAVRPRCGKPPGFALVVTLMMMVLLVVIAVGLLSLSSISLRSSASENAMLRARANARIGLIIALGQLQENLGPDQRVSADAAITSGASTPPAHPHWISVWRTDQEDGKPWITRDGENGGLADQRQTSGWDPRDEKLTTLVSGNETEFQYQDDEAGDTRNMIPLVDKGSLGSAAKPEEVVRAPLVSLDSSRKNAGSYAWWIGDLGTKANVATIDASEGTPNGTYHAQMLAQDASWTAFGTKEISNEQRSKLVSQQQLPLVEDNATDRHFHDLTVFSAGLPINVRDGGWRRDLTAFLVHNGPVPGLKSGDLDLPGLADSDNMVGPANPQADAASANPKQASRFDEVAPNFGLLRNWAKRSADAPLGSYSADTELAKTTADGIGRNLKAVDFKDRTTTNLMPVLTDGSMYYNLSYYPLAKPNPANPYGMRIHYYPRVTLWNPYNFALNVPMSAIYLQINGNKWVEVTLQDGTKRNYRMFWGLGGTSRGSLLFRMQAATLQPGESLVWSPAGNAPYNEVNFAKNVLTPSQAPSPRRAFYQDKREDNQPLFQVERGYRPPPGLADNVLPQIPQAWREIVPPKPAGNVQATQYTQADDYFMTWKPLTASTFSEVTFSNYPMGRYISCAYQYGDEDELPVEWTGLDPVPFPKSTMAIPIIDDLPDRRTRDGFRLRWFQETQSNLYGSGSLAGTTHFEDSAIGNWNMRASWSFRNPFDNVTDVAPNFFGIYTRDLFDDDVGWSSIAPRSSDGSSHGDPFEQPILANAPRILFDIPRTGTEIASLGAFQHVNFSEFIWHPTYALGNSLADPRIPPLHSEPDRSERINKDKGGWNQDSIGRATDGRSDRDENTNRTDEDNWAFHARALLNQAALSQTLIYDLSYELNHTLWDSYFLSTGTAEQKQALLQDPQGNPLPNGRIRPNRMAGPTTVADLTDFHRAAPHLLIEGAFNVNSTSATAWESLLLSGLGKQDDADAVAFPRILDAKGGPWDGKENSDKAVWSGQRVFSREEIRKLAEQIVIEVKARGPFLSLADFVNRRLSEDETGKKGALQAAIDSAQLNATFVEKWPLDNSTTLPDFKSIDYIEDSTRFEQTLKPETTAWGALGFLTQADLLQFIGPSLSARSDTFRIRAYGESLDASGKVTARAWCEAVVQRSPEYVDPSDDLLETPATLNATNRKFGRRFEVVSFRWLNPKEI